VRTVSRKTLVLALVTVGLVVAATSAAFDISPMQWLSQSQHVGEPQPTEQQNKTTPATAQP
jgi:hypothetical protein